MKWKMNLENVYPNIILSDCIIDDIYIDGENVIMNFFDSGFIIKDYNSSKYYRTYSSQIILEKCDISNSSIKFVCKKRKKLKVNIVKEMEFNTFFKNISTSKWRFEVVEEFYSDVGGMYIGKVRSQKESFWCYIKIYFKNIIYFWNEVDYQHSID